MNNLILHNSDSLELLKEIETGCAQVVFADPPFNVGKPYKGAPKDSRADYYKWCEQWISQCFRALRDDGLFFLMTIQNHLERLLPIMGKYGRFADLIIWRNVSACHNNRAFWCAYQPIMMYSKTKDFYFDVEAELRPIKDLMLRWGGYTTAPKGLLLNSWDDIPFVYAGGIIHPEAILQPGTNKKAHPCQSPVGLSRRCILFASKPGDLVVDPFMGIGTTAIACLETDRRFVGCEISPHYYQLAIQRIEQWKQQLSLFPIK